MLRFGGVAAAAVMEQHGGRGQSTRKKLCRRSSSNRWVRPVLSWTKLRLISGSDLIPTGTPRFRSGIGVRSATSQSSSVAPLNNHSQAETRYWLAMLQIPVACLNSVRCDMIEAVGDKAEPDAAGFRHRLAKRPDPIKLSCAPTFHVPAFLRTEGSARKRGKVAVGPVILNIDPDCGTGADRAREPSSGV